MIRAAAKTFRSDWRTHHAPNERSPSMADLVFVATKLLQEALYPINWAILFFLISFFLMRCKRTRGAAWFQFLGLLLLIVPSTGCVAEALMHPLETASPIKRIEE